jgi:hypothetical protein
MLGTWAFHERMSKPGSSSLVLQSQLRDCLDCIIVLYYCQPNGSRWRKRDGSAVGAGSSCPPPIYRPYTHQPQLPSSVTLRKAKGQARWAEMLRCAQHNRVLPFIVTTDQDHGVSRVKSRGNVVVKRIFGAPVSCISSRSRPMANPPCGGMP